MSFQDDEYNARGGGDGDDNFRPEEEAVQGGYEDSKGNVFRKKRRPSLGNPKIKPRQVEDDHSTLQLLSKQNEERKLKQEEFGDPANEMFAPKNNYILILLQQHLLSAGYERTAKFMKEEADKKVGHKIDRFMLPKTKNLRGSLVESLKTGNEKAFFEARQYLHADLNYYQLDFELSLELEMKTRVYFALYYLINLEIMKIDPEECKKRTRERMEVLKTFFVEKGSHFSDDSDLKEYLKIPYLVESMPGDNQLLNFVLSKDFYTQVYEENTKEMEKVIFFATEATRHRSFITKLYEYYIKYHPNASSSQLTEGIYQQVEAAIEQVKQHASKHSEEAEELQGLQDQLTHLVETTRSRFQVYLDEEKAKAKQISEDNFQILNVVQVNKECRAANEKFVKRWEEVKKLTTEFEEVTALLQKINEGKNPDELPAEDLKVQKTYLQKKQRLLLLKLNMISLEMKKPDVATDAKKPEASK